VKVVLGKEAQELKDLRRDKLEPSFDELTNEGYSINSTVNVWVEIIKTFPFCPSVVEGRYSVLFQLGDDVGSKCWSANVTQQNLDAYKENEKVASSK
jgi:hypothetical protein